MARADIHLRLGFVFNISINYTKGLQSNNLTVIDPQFYFHPINGYSILGILLSKKFNSWGVTKL